MPHGPPPPLGESLKEPVWSRHESLVRATLLSPAAAHAPLGKSYYLLGEELLQRGAYDDAAWSYLAAHREQPKVAAYMNLGVALRLGGRHDDARRAFELHLHFHPANLQQAAIAYRNLAALLPEGDAEHRRLLALAEALPSAVPPPPPPPPTAQDFLAAVPAWREAEPPWLHPRWAAQVEPLDSAGEAFLVRDLLSEAEVAHVRHRARSLLTEGGPFATMVLESWDRKGREVDPVLARIEARVGNLTGIPPHAREGMPRVSLTRPWTLGAAVKNLHHDQNGVADHDGVLRVRPRRGAAALFLSVRRDAPDRALPHMWHGGCRVRQGAKWTMQLFKELPFTEPPPVRLSE